MNEDIYYIETLMAVSELAWAEAEQDTLQWTILPTVKFPTVITAHYYLDKHRDPRNSYRITDGGMIWEA